MIAFFVTELAKEPPFFVTSASRAFCDLLRVPLIAIVQPESAISLVVQVWPVKKGRVWYDVTVTNKCQRNCFHSSPDITPSLFLLF